MARVAAGVETVLGSVESSTSQVGDVVRPSHPTREVCEIGGCVRGASNTGSPRCLIERRRNLRVGSLGAECQVPGSFLRIARQRGEADMERSPLAQRGIHVDGGRQQGVREPYPPTRPFDDPGTLRPGKGFERPLARSGDLEQQLPRRLRRSCDREQGLVGRRRQCSQPR